MIRHIENGEKFHTTILNPNSSGVNSPKGFTILEHPIDHIDGRFMPHSRYD
jgi:hypothetical protein